MKNTRKNVTEAIRSHYSSKGIGNKIAKELYKVERATQFIGEGGAGSSTEVIRLAWGELANTGDYTSDDVVMIASNGNRRGAVMPIQFGKPYGVYKNVDLAAKAGARFIIDTASYRNSSRYNIGEKLVAEYLVKLGYEELENTGMFSRKSSPLAITSGEQSTQHNLINRIKEKQTMKSLNILKQINNPVNINSFVHKEELELLLAGRKEAMDSKNTKAFTTAVYRRYRNAIRTALYAGLGKNGYTVRNALDGEQPSCKAFKEGVKNACALADAVNTVLAKFNERIDFGWFAEIGLQLPLKVEKLEGDDTRWSTQTRVGSLAADTQQWVDVNYEAVAALKDVGRVNVRSDDSEEITFKAVLHQINEEFKALTPEELAEAGYDSYESIPKRLIVAKAEAEFDSLGAYKGDAAWDSIDNKTCESLTPYRHYLSQFDMEAVVRGYYNYVKGCMVDASQMAKDRLRERLGKELFDEVISDNNADELTIWNVIDLLFKHLMRLRKIVDAESSATKRYNSIIAQLNKIDAAPEGSDHGREWLDEEDSYGITHRSRKEDYECARAAYTSLMKVLDAASWEKLQSFANDVANRNGFDWVDIRPTYWLPENNEEECREVGGFEEVIFTDHETGEVKKRMFAYRFDNFSDMNSRFSQLLIKLSQAWRNKQERAKEVLDNQVIERMGELKVIHIKANPFKMAELDI